MSAKLSVLAIDSAMSGCGVGVVPSGIVRRSDRPHGQAEILVPLVQEAMAEAGIVFSDLDVIVTTVGPGSFTGLRTGLSAARSFALALDKPLVGLSTFEVLFAQYDGKSEIVCVLVDSRRDEFFAQIYEGGVPLYKQGALLTQDQVLEALNGRRAAFIGDAAERFISCADIQDVVVKGCEHPDPLVMARLGLERYEAGGELPSVEPLYLREADVSVSKKVQRVLES